MFLKNLSIFYSSLPNLPLKKNLSYISFEIKPIYLKYFFIHLLHLWKIFLYLWLYVSTLVCYTDVSSQGQLT